MRRGEVWTVAGGQDHAGKPRPVVMVQDDRFEGTDALTICAFTTDDTDAPLFRLVVQPNERNGLRVVCRLMVDKITTVRRAKFRQLVGRLDDEDMVRLNQAMGEDQEEAGDRPAPLLQTLVSGGGVNPVPTQGLKWRRGRDLNPRYGCPYAAFRVRCIQPLCHLSYRGHGRRGARCVVVRF